MQSIHSLIEKYQNVFYMEDTNAGAIPVITAAVIQNRMKGDPIWIMLVGASSAGKTELINCITGMDFVYAVSDLTPNTFLSGMQNYEKETSLLKIIGSRGVVTMKDFTTLLSKNSEDQQQIMAQMREIYDGHLTKRTGKGDDLEWGPGGKLNFIAGTTEAIYDMEERFSAMGTRWINYALEGQDRKETTRRSFSIKPKIEEYRTELQQDFSQYITKMISEIPGEEIELESHLQEEIFDLANFAAIARSSVTRNYKEEMQMVHSQEMPMRLANQIYSFGQVFTFMNGGTLGEFYRSILYKIPFDCIPKQRRMVIETLAQYKELTSAGIATLLHYPTNRCHMWLEDLNVLGICRREKAGSVGFDKWILNEEYRRIMKEYYGVKVKGELLYSDADLQEEPAAAAEREEFNPDLMQASQEYAEREFNDF